MVAPPRSSVPRDVATGTDGLDEDSGPTRRRSVGSRLLRLLLAALACIALVVLAYYVALHDVVVNSDGATLALEGYSLDHGNFLLNHWNLSLDSFWTSDAAINAAIVAFLGVQPTTSVLGPAIAAAAVTVIGAVLAAQGRRGAPAVAGAVTVLAVLAFPTFGMAGFWLRGGQHVVTALAALIAFLAVRRGRFGVGWIVAVIFLAAGTLGDLQEVVFGCVPLVIAGLLAAVRARRWGALAAPVSAGLGGGVLAAVVREIALAIGSYGIASANARAKPHQMVVNVTKTPGFFAQLMGVHNTAFGTGGVPDWLQHLHGIIVVVLGLAALLAALRLVVGVVSGPGRADGRPRWWRREPEQALVDDALLAACFAPIGVFAVLTTSDLNTQFVRYLMPTIIFSAVLGARIVARWFAFSRFRSLKAGATVAGLACVALFAAATGYQLDQPVPTTPATQLVSLLREHGLTRGLGDYWSSSITTVWSHGHQTVRPVIAGPKGKIIPYTRESDNQWYRGKFQFLVTNRTDPFGTVNMATAKATWGQPAHIYRSGYYNVLVWSKPLSVTPTKARGALQPGHI